MLPQEILKLSVQEKLELLDELWEDIAKHSDEITLSPEQEAELDRRLAMHVAEPEAGIPWAEVKRKLDSKG